MFSQDLLVQGLKNRLTLEAYCTHARIAMEVADLEEFGQCQAMIYQLHQTGTKSLQKYRIEFLGYRILYYLLTDNMLDLIRFLRTLSRQDKQQTAIKHALSVTNCIQAFNYHQFMKLYRTAPNLSGLLMKQLMINVRKEALKRMVKAYYEIPLEFLQSELGFDTQQECEKYVQDCGGVINFQKKVVLSKMSSLDFT